MSTRARTVVGLSLGLSCLFWTTPATAAAPPDDKELIARLEPCEELATCAPSVALLKRGKAAIPALLDGLGHEKELVRFWVCGILSELKAKDAVVPLFGALGDKAIRVRAAAAFALGAIGDRRATRKLLEALRDADQIGRAHV